VPAGERSEPACIRGGERSSPVLIVLGVPAGAQPPSKARGKVLGAQAPLV